MIKVHIEYCIKWNYGPEFDRVSKIINSNFKNIVIKGNPNSTRNYDNISLLLAKMLEIDSENRCNIAFVMNHI